MGKAALAAVPMAMTIPDLVAIQKQHPDWQMELVDGSIVIMGPSDFVSEEIGGEFLSQLRNWIRPRRLGRVAGSSAGFILPSLAEEDGEETNGEARNLRAPDVAFVRAERLKKSKRDFVELVPDLAVEIKSKTDSIKKLREKIQMFLDLGAEIGILIDPDKLTLTVYRLNQQPLVLRDGDTLTLPDLLPGWELKISELWPLEF